MHANYRLATAADSPLLASMNQQLIRDEGHRNCMSLPELEGRMTGWLESDYRAVIFETDGSAAGYALYRTEPDFINLRQFFVRPDFRRKGIGRAAIEWLTAHAWQRGERIRIEVLSGNSVGIAFWRAVGFSHYALTMERE